MIAQAAIFLLDTLFGLFTLSVLLRFYLQLVGAPFHNPISQAIVAFTNFLVRPTRRIIPSLGGLDMSTLLLAFIAQLILQAATLWLQGYPLMLATGTAYAALVGLAALGLVKLSIYIFLYAVIIQAILSWVNPYTPVAPLLDSLTRPLMRPLRGKFTMGSGIDLTPLVVFLIAQLLLMLVVAPIEMQLQRLL
ncbi:YggT family protein [Novimethylophilus kurashikiensis]|uniref:YggT family protein n=1 Tax=Novimethylophilus kurashikiensis TaxID=1825523 RepID=A0A2R5FGP6_9PROT|nr:YggT family protein [Novimethylophilus kurashikiensis]GBG15633.1 YggT family protein [Novimethylophilus kurashikiensis]